MHLLKASSSLDLRVKKGAAVDLFAPSPAPPSVHAGHSRPQLPHLGDQSSGYNSSSSSVSGDATTSSASPPSTGSPSNGAQQRIRNVDQGEESGCRGAMCSAGGSKRLSMVAEERDSNGSCGGGESSTRYVKCFKT